MAGEMFTLLDYAASQKDNYLVQGFVNALMDDKSPGGGMGLLSIFPIMTVNSLTGTVPRLDSEGSPLPVTRPIGGTYNTGVVALKSESAGVGNYGQDVVIDQAYTLKQSNFLPGAQPEVIQTKFLASRINRVVNNALMNGNLASDPNGMNGMRYWVDSNMVFSAASKTPNGSVYANGLNVWSTFTSQKGRDFLTLLDYAISAVGADGEAGNDGPPSACIVCNDQVKRALQIAVRDAGGTGSFYSFGKDYYERKVETYRGLPIVNPGSKNPVKTLVDAISDTNAILPNNFSFGTASTATEIYVVKTGKDEGCVMLEYSPLRVRTVAEEMTQGPAKLIRADWYPGFYRFKESAIAKVTGVIAV